MSEELTLEGLNAKINDLKNQLEDLQRSTGIYDLKYLVNLFNTIKINSDGSEITSNNFFDTLSLNGELIDYGVTDNNTLTIKHGIASETENNSLSIYKYELEPTTNQIILKGTVVGKLDKYGHLISVAEDISTQTTANIDLNDLVGSLTVRGESGTITFTTGTTVTEEETN